MYSHNTIFFISLSIDFYDYFFVLSFEERTKEKQGQA